MEGKGVDGSGLSIASLYSAFVVQYSLSVALVVIVFSEVYGGSGALGEIWSNIEVCLLESSSNTIKLCYPSPLFN